MISIFKSEFELRQAFVKTFQSMQGRGVLDYILNISGLSRCVQAPPQMDALQLAWWEGRRALAQDILNLINMNEERNYV